MGNAPPDVAPTWLGDADATRIARARRAAGLSIQELATLVGVDRRTIFNAEHGTHCPNVRTLTRIADALGVRADDLIEDRWRA